MSAPARPGRTPETDPGRRLEDPGQTVGTIEETLGHNGTEHRLLTDC